MDIFGILMLRLNWVVLSNLLTYNMWQLLSEWCTMHRLPYYSTRSKMQIYLLLKDGFSGMDGGQQSTIGKWVSIVSEQWKRLQ